MKSWKYNVSEVIPPTLSTSLVLICRLWPRILWSEDPWWPHILPPLVTVENLLDICDSIQNRLGETVIIRSSSTFRLVIISAVARGKRRTWHVVNIAWRTWCSISVYPAQYSMCSLDTVFAEVPSPNCKHHMLSAQPTGRAGRHPHGGRMSPHDQKILCS